MLIHQDNGAYRALCHSHSENLTHDPQAVTCPRCVAIMELQPA